MLFRSWSFGYREQLARGQVIAVAAGHATLRR
jgi:hypothetical protein